jgi:hypothetical protein
VTVDASERESIASPSNHLSHNKTTNLGQIKVFPRIHKNGAPARLPRKCQKSGSRKWGQMKLKEVTALPDLANFLSFI